MQKSCLLIHGLGGQPFEMERLAETLEKSGIAPRLVLLPGHGGNVEEYGRARFAHFTEHVEREYLELAAAGKTAIAGFSLGGLLALWLAARHNPNGIAVLASPLRLANLYPFFMADWRLFFLSIFGRVLEKVEPPESNPKAREIAPWRGHNTVFPPQLLDLDRNTRKLEKDLPKVSCPLLLMQDYNDRTCNKWNTWHIAENCSSSDVTVRLSRIKNRSAGRHLIVTHQETRDYVATEVTAFVQRIFE